MTFRVYTGDIYRYSDMISRATMDFDEAKGFLKKNSTYDGTGGGSELWEQVITQHEALAGRVESALSKHRSILNASAEELSASGEYYGSTDKVQAAEVDATYPEAKSSAKPSAADSEAGFNDRKDAQASLKDEPEPGFIEERFDGFAGDRWNTIKKHYNDGDGLAVLGDGIGYVLDFTSPSSLVNEGVKLAFGRDILDECAQLIAGDWGEFDNFTKMWEKLAGFTGRVSDNISGGNRTLSVSWEGNAAATAYEYFKGVSDKLDELRDSLVSLKGNYDDIASQVMSFVNTLKACITTILDLAIGVALKAAAGGAAATTGVGLILTGASAVSIAYDITKMIDKFSEILSALTLLYGAINSAGSSGMGESEKALAKISNFPVPQRSYDHPGV